MEDIIFYFEWILEHVQANVMAYAIGGPVVVLAIYFSRPYSTSILLHFLEISIYLMIMHTVVHVCTRMGAWFHNSTQMQALGDRNLSDQVAWGTPWIEFWEWELYDPGWMRWVEIVLALIIIGLVRYYRPLKISRKNIINPDAAKPIKPTKPARKKKKDVLDDDDDDWGASTTRRFTLPQDLANEIDKNKQ